MHGSPYQQTNQVKLDAPLTLAFRFWIMAPHRVFVAKTVRHIVAMKECDCSFLFPRVQLRHTLWAVILLFIATNSQHIFFSSDKENNEQKTTGTHLKARNSVRVSVQIALVSFVHCNQSVKIFCFSPTVAAVLRTHELNDAKYQLVFNIEMRGQTMLLVDATPELWVELH